jgi:protocatechuate 3,4-dioxygenase beta subunit
MLIARRQLIGGGAAFVGVSAAAAAQPLVATSDQMLGPFYPVVRPADEDADLTRIRGRSQPAKGNPINVLGRVLDVKGNPVRNARLEIWQANAVGRYAHPGDSANPAPVDPNFQGFATIHTDRDGGFRFRTIKPGAYPIGGGMMRTPHIHVDVTGRNERLTTQMYFPGEPLNEKDVVLLTASSKDSVISRLADPLSGDPNTPAFAWDIVLAVG